MIRKAAKITSNRAPFQSGDVVYYPESPARRFVVAHCYRVQTDGVEQWIVAEINADTHDAGLLVKDERRPCSRRSAHRCKE